MLLYSAVGDFVVIILPIWFTFIYLHRLYTVSILCLLNSGFACSVW